MKKSLDIGTVLGLVLGLGFIAMAMGANVPAFINIPSIFVTVGGTVAAMFISYPLKTVLGIMGVLKNAVFSSPEKNAETINMIIELAQRARREGILSLESQAQEIEDPFTKSGIQMAVDGVEPERLKNILSIEILYLEDRHKKGIDFWEQAAMLAPGFGMIGTLIGLVIMLLNMSDPNSIGPAMAVALITTFYGSVIANLFCLPFAKKLKVYSEREILTKDLILAGIIAIQEGENPRLVEQKLNSFISPPERVDTTSKK